MAGWFPTIGKDVERELVEEIAQSFRTKLAKIFGITMIQDHAGEFGAAGKIYLTIRHTDPKIGDCHMTMEVTQIKKGMV